MNSYIFGLYQNVFFVIGVRPWAARTGMERNSTKKKF
jgi:hypothetical protein